MNLDKSYEFFQPESCQHRIHIIGCGAVGSTVAEILARYGLTNITLYDFDTVDDHNIANQMFRAKDIGRPKVEALAEILEEINPDIVDGLRLEATGYESQRLTGYVFLCVDNIDLRRKIVKDCKTSKYIKAMFDFRIRLADAQAYACRWVVDEIENFLGSMDFSHEEAVSENPKSACNVELSSVATVRMICTVGVENFINFIKSKGTELKRTILTNNPMYEILAFS